MLLYEYENGKVQIYWDEEVACPILRAEGFRGLEEVKQQMNKILEVAVQKGVNKYISNFQSLGVFGQEITEWLIQEYYPNLVKAGVKYIATISAQSALTRISFNPINQAAAKMGVERRTFPNLEEAKQWLKTI